MTISVLYIHHAGAFGGASRSLLEMIAALPHNAVTPYLIAPNGSVAAAAASLGIPILTSRGISQFDCTRFGHYRGLRWLVLLRELWLLPFTLSALVRARVRWKGIQIVHVNDITALLPALVAKLLFQTPVIMHVRSVMQTTGMPVRRRILSYVLRRYVDRIIAIDETVRSSLPDDLPVMVIHNGFATKKSALKLDPRSLPDVLSSDSFKVAMVGNLLPMKGLSEFIDAARICVEKGSPIDFLIIGDNIRKISGLSGWLLNRLNFARDLKAEIEANVHKYGLEDRVHLIGFMSNIEDVYDRINVLCFPSHLNAVGRPVFEAAFSGVPSIVAIDNPRSDTIIDRKTGICIKPGDAVELARAIEFLYRYPKERGRMGQEANALAHRNFDIKKNAVLMHRIYCEIRPQSRPNTDVNAWTSRKV